jgi:soluble lytic murein transglycosylase-like protein
MKKQIKVISSLLICAIVVISCQAVTSADVIESDENSSPSNEADEDYAHRSLIEEYNDFVYEIKEESLLTNTEEAEYYEKDKEELENIALEVYISELTGLSNEAVDMIISQSNEIGIDPFVVVGIIRVESVFDPYVVGSLGERGLGQLMANTAEPVAKNLGIEYNPDKLFEPVYNILLFTTQLNYLYEFYDKDIHKTLTAYNRGQYGLEKYIASRNGHTNPAISDYSITVLEFAGKYKQGFDN